MQCVSINHFQEKQKIKNSATVDAIAVKWFEKVLQYKKYSTYIKYKNIYVSHIRKHIGDCSISCITDSDCMDLLQKEYSLGDGRNNTLSKSTLNTIANVLKQILWYGENEIPMGEIKKEILFSNPEQYTNVTIFSKEEQLRLEKFLLQNMDSYKLGILLCQFTGLRLGEICALPTENIILDQKILRVTQTVQRIKTERGEKKTELLVGPPKTIRSAREIPLCDKLLHVLKDHMPNTKYLINGDFFMEPRTYQYKFQRYLEELSIESKNFHSLRHTFATNCIENGMEPKCLSELLGHASVQTTLNKYVHPSFESKLKQINLLLLEGGQTSGHLS